MKSVLGRSVKFLLEACALAGAVAQEVQAGAANLAVALNNNFFNAR